MGESTVKCYMCEDHPYAEIAGYKISKVGR